MKDKAKEGAAERQKFAFALDSTVRTPVTRCALPPFPGQASVAAVESEAHSRNTTPIEPRGAPPGFGCLHWHRPLFVLAPCTKAAFLASAFSLFDPGDTQSLNNRGHTAVRTCVNMSDSDKSHLSSSGLGPTNHSHNPEPVTV
ncbi:hypothetical protein F2P81_011414 [Scophthalmus maximus]|uniref:Uncharacterized protein n=1 Tax=Scophthalmus maximus TaxID=52904 RepID=A0A6A4T1I3_SCOMX|nr:hypothetical protein F2P81_011414 [Scophthalmus maximus]